MAYLITRLIMSYEIKKEEKKEGHAYIIQFRFIMDEKCHIMKTCLYNFDPLKPHFYIVKLGFTGVYIIFLFLLKNIECGYTLEWPHRGSSNECP